MMAGSIKKKHTVMNAHTPAPNQVFVHTKEGYFFFSYGTPIAKIFNGKTYLDKRHWNYSRTTGKYRGIFLGEDLATTRKKIASGEYILTNL